MLSLKLLEELLQAAVARGENPEVAVQRANIFVFFERSGNTYCNGFLPDTAEPLAHSALAQQLKHALFNHPWFKNEFIKMNELFVGELLALKFHGVNISMLQNPAGFINLRGFDKRWPLFFLYKTLSLS